MLAKKASVTLQPVQLASNQWTNATEGWSSVLLQTGEALFQNRSASRVLAAGDVVVMREGAGGVIQAKTPSTFVAWCLRFFPDQFNGLLEQHERLMLEKPPEFSNRIRFYHAGSQIAQQFGALAARSRINSQFDHWRAIELVAAILGGEFSNMGANGEASNSPTCRLSDILGRIAFDEFQQLSVEELARRCGYSRRHLSRLFHELYGRSVVSYKIEMRLEKAAALLAKSEAKIIHIALECGFSHLGLFSAKFKERFGASPGQWRRMNSEQASPKMSGNGNGVFSLHQQDFRVSGNGAAR